MIADNRAARPSHPDLLSDDPNSDRGGRRQWRNRVSTARLIPQSWVTAPVRRWTKAVLRNIYHMRAALSSPSITILRLHEVHPLGYTPEKFEALLAPLTRQMDFLRLDEACSMLKARRTPRRDAIVLTFDDGLQNNLVYAYPLLKRYGTKATFFVVPGLIAEGGWLWTHEVKVRLHSLAEGQVPQYPELYGCHQSLPGSMERASQTQKIVENMKALPKARRQKIIEALRALAPHLLHGHPLHDLYGLMSWDELRSLDRELIEIGSHSYTHGILQGLADDQLEQEVKASREAIEAQLGRRVGSFCYPNGDFDEKGLHWVRRCYDQAVTVCEGGVSSEPDFHQLPRIYVTDCGDTLFRIARYRGRTKSGPEEGGFPQAGYPLRGE